MMNFIASICLSVLMCFGTAGLKAQTKKSETGTASYYAAKFNGRAMANGKKYDENKLTAAHNKLPLGTFVKVSNLRNKKSVIVEVTDRMHHKNKRLIDLSKAAARQLGFLKQGLTKVKVEVIEKPQERP